MELTREQIKDLLHSATGNVRDFVMDEDGFIDDWIKRNRVKKNVVLDSVSELLAQIDMNNSYSKGFKDAMIKYRKD